MHMTRIISCKDILMANEIRINKYLAEAGICSRRGADELVAKGVVTVNGVTAEPGTKVASGDVVKVKGKPVKLVEEKVIIAYNKPLGLTCTASHEDPDNIFDHTDFGMRLSYVGRLDKDSHGLLLLTNDGDLSNAIQKSVNNHEKEYRVRVNKPITEDFIKSMEKGVPILDTVTKPCRLIKVDNFSFKIIITQGLNRQIRRMCDYFGYRVVDLKRVRVLNIKIGNMRPGTWRRLTQAEEAELRRLVEGK